MFCFWIKRRLYDFLEGYLSKSQSQKIEAHLKKCSYCSRGYQATKQLLGLAAQKRPPEPSPEFWQNFSEGLRKKLGEEKVVPQPVRFPQLHLPRLSPRPALALAAVAVLVIGLSLYLRGTFTPEEVLLTQADEQLINNIEVFEEVTEEVVLFEDEESLLDEIDLLEEMS